MAIVLDVSSVEAVSALPVRSPTTFPVTGAETCANVTDDYVPTA